MDMQTRPQPNTISFASRLVLLVMVAGVIDFDSGNPDHRAHHRIEILLQAARPDTQSPGVAISEEVPGIADAKDRSAYFYVEQRAPALFTQQHTGQVNTRGFYSSRIETASFNIPHQNSDDEEAFVNTPT